MYKQLAPVICSAVFYATHAPCVAQEKPTAAEVKAIAEEAFIYGFPMNRAYGTMYAYAVDTKSDQYKAPFNEIHNTARVYTPKDTAIIAPNSDTPYSWVWMDLRAEPIVLSVPTVEKRRYYSVQLIDFYTFNYGYIGSRATGNEAGNFLVAGPGWKGAAPEGIKKVFRCETEFCGAQYRTQLFNPADIDNVKKVQAGYKVQTLSAFLQKAAPAAAPKIDWPKYSEKEALETDPFAYMNFLLQFCPVVEQDKALRDRFAKIGIGGGKSFTLDKLPKENREQLALGIKDAIEKIRKNSLTFGQDVNGWRMQTSGYGSRAAYKGDWLLRAVVAEVGIFANDPAEAFYPVAFTDEKGGLLDGSKGRYTITFPKGGLPPVNAFWSVTMYDKKTQLLVTNPINRYLINSPMLPNLNTNEDGSLTLYIQKDSPGEDKEPNWLPAPAAPFFVAMRLYLPKEEALNGKWKPPAVQRVK